MDLHALHFPEFYEEAEKLKFSRFPLKTLTKYITEETFLEENIICAA